MDTIYWTLGNLSPVQTICNMLPFSRALTLTTSVNVESLPASKVTEWFMIFFLVHKVTMGFAVIGVINGALSAISENEMNSPNSACS